MDKKTLREYRELLSEIEMLEEKIARLDSEINSPKNQVLSDAPRGGNPVEMADKVVRLIELKNTYNNQLDKAFNLRVEIENTIQNLDRPIERTIMSYRYLMGMEWESICVKVSYSWRQVHYIHSKALKKVAQHEMCECDIAHYCTHECDIV